MPGVWADVNIVNCGISENQNILAFCYRDILICTIDDFGAEIFSDRLVGMMVDSDWSGVAKGILMSECATEADPKRAYKLAQMLKNNVSVCPQSPSR